MVEPVNKIIGKPTQGVINQLKFGFGEKAAKMKTTADMIEQCKNMSC